MVGPDLNRRVGERRRRWTSAPRPQPRQTPPPAALDDAPPGDVQAGLRAHAGRSHTEIRAAQLTASLRPDLNVYRMTQSPCGTVDKPGRRVQQKAGLNRAILDAAPGELHRQLTYKTRWYGSVLGAVRRIT